MPGLQKLGVRRRRQRARRTVAGAKQAATCGRKVQAALCFNHGNSASGRTERKRFLSHARFRNILAQEVAKAAEEFRALGVAADAVEADLATLAATNGHRVDYLLANAGHGVGDAIEG